MAKQRAIFVTGKISNLIFYNYNGKPCARIMPLEVKQTEATKARALEFGKASRISAGLRQGLGNIFSNTKERTFRFRFNTEVYSWVRHGSPSGSLDNNGLPFINGFEFNTKVRLRDRIKKPIVANRTNEKIILDIPAFLPEKELAAPRGTKMIRWQIAAVSCTNDERMSRQHSRCLIRLIPSRQNRLNCLLPSIPAR